MVNYNMKQENNPMIAKLIGYSIAGLFLIITFFSTIVTIDAGNVGVITRFGAVNRVAYPGITFKLPYIENVAIMNTQTQKDQVDSSSASKDLQTVNSKIAINYHLQGSQAVAVYQNIGVNYQDIVVSPAIQEAFKAITSKYTAEQLITNRDQVRYDAQNSLAAKLIVYHIIVDNFNIVNFDFSPDFNNAIEQKQVAQQDLERARIEAEKATTQAQGQADAQKILKDTGSLSPEYLQFLAVQKWNGILPQATNGMPFLNIPSK